MTRLRSPLSHSLCLSLSRCAVVVLTRVCLGRVARRRANKPRIRRVVPAPGHAMSFAASSSAILYVYVFSLRFPACFHGNANVIYLIFQLLPTLPAECFMKYAKFSFSCYSYFCCCCCCCCLPHFFCLSLLSVFHLFFSSRRFPFWVFT